MGIKMGEEREERKISLTHTQPRPPCEGCINTGTVYCTVPALFLATQVYVPESATLELKISNVPLAAMTRPPITNSCTCMCGMGGRGGEGGEGGEEGGGEGGREGVTWCGEEIQGEEDKRRGG